MSPMEPPVTRVLVHEKPDNCTSWSYHVTPGWYIGTSIDHYRCMQCYITITGIVCITDTLQYIRKSFNLPNTTTEYYLRQAIVGIISIIKDTPKKFSFLSYGDATKNSINHIAHILQQSTTQPRLPILP